MSTKRRIEGLVPQSIGTLRLSAWPGLLTALLAAVPAGPTAQAQQGIVWIGAGHPPTRVSATLFHRRNVLVLIADDVGVDKIQPYIEHYNWNARTDDDIDVDIDGVDMTPSTPTIAKLADAGVMFVNAWACPTCSPTRASLLTGTHPFRHRVYRPEDSERFSGDGDPLTADDPTTIAEALASSGYASGLFGKWHLGADSDHGPVDQGWVIHEGSLGGGLTDYYTWTKCTTTEPGQSGVDSHELADIPASYATTVNCADASSWIGGQTGHWMAIVAFNAAHSVSVAGAPEGSGTLVDQGPPTSCGCGPIDENDEDEVFRATIECMDTKIALLLASIPAAKLANTTIIFMGDNGTEAGRSETFGPSGHAKDTIYEGGIHVPLIIADGYRYLVNEGQQVLATGGTGRVVSPGRISAALVQSVDLFATVAAIAAAANTCGVDAVSLVPLLENTATSVRDTCFAEYEYEEAGVRTLVRAVRGTTYKLIVEDGAWDELYNLHNDRWEETNLLTDGSITDLEMHIVEDLKLRMNEILAVPGCY